MAVLFHAGEFPMAELPSLYVAEMRACLAEIHKQQERSDLTPEQQLDEFDRIVAITGSEVDRSTSAPNRAL